eukprot:m.258634 g.258634  ORF g.258634 m.258634 type:complete len:56 (+) comp242892_c0_seq1:57-224(+)
MFTLSKVCLELQRTFVGAWRSRMVGCANPLKSPLKDSISKNNISADLSAVSLDSK